MSGKIQFVYIWIALFLVMVTAVAAHSQNTAITPRNHKFSTPKTQSVTLPPTSRHPLSSMTIVDRSPDFVSGAVLAPPAYILPRVEPLTPMASRSNDSPKPKTPTASTYPLERLEISPRQPENQLPNRLAPGICTVTTTAEIGPGSLHQCILDAMPGDTINFDTGVFPPGGSGTILLLSNLLPEITVNNLTIDGSNAGVTLMGVFNGPGIVINGASNGTIQGLEIYFFTDGIVLMNGANNNTIGGDTPAERNVISGNFDAGVVMLDNGTDNNQIIGNYIGTDNTGTASLGNYWGVAVASGGQNNIIGGDIAATRNIISGNLQGVQFEDAGTTNNQIIGNYIGINAAGTAIIGNDIGVVVAFNSPGNFVGGDTVGKRNIISGNNIGVVIQDGGTTGNQVQGNYIGTNPAGTNALANNWGISIGFGAQNNLIGGNTAEARNIISGNTQLGIQLQNSGTNNNKIQGNYIGTNITGDSALSNEIGVYFISGPQNNLVGGHSSGEGNVISGNTTATSLGVGVVLLDSTTRYNGIVGNYIGTNATGNLALGNNGGIIISGARDTTIGGTTSDARNIISGNNIVGIQLQLNAAYNHIVGNFVGTDVAGELRLDNSSGVIILTGSHHNIIGGNSTAARNVISGNNVAGISLASSNTSNNEIIGNYIGLDATGNARLGNLCLGVFIDDFAHHNTIGGTAVGEANIISGNGVQGQPCGGIPQYGVGVQIEGGANNNQLLGNYIGTNVTGTVALGNIIAGITLVEEAQHNTIGGTNPAARNIVSGNLGPGIILQGTGTYSNEVLGNYIGVDVTGVFPLSNTHGIVLSNGAHENIVGGEAEGSGNIIGSNSDVGIQLQNGDTTQNQVLGNYIGTDVNGMLALGGNIGIGVGFGAHHNIFGGCSAAARNLISGNNQGPDQIGVGFEGLNTHGNEVLGNFIGTNVTGTVALTNSYGVFIAEGAHDNIIGGDQPDCRNLISGNSEAGVWVQDNQSDDNQVVGNYIGTDVTGEQPLANSIGVALVNGVKNTVIGDSTTGAKNIISGNEIGVFMSDLGTDGNAVMGNYIGTDVTGEQPLANSIGVALVNGVENIVIGDSTTEARNIISGNNIGIRISDEDTKRNMVKGNSIGTDVMGLPLANEVVGISLENGTQFNTIGVSNTIAYNEGIGVMITGTKTLNNTITRNSIHHNGGWPIEFVPEVPVPIPPPSFCYDATQMMLRGDTCPNCQVELFVSSLDTFLEGEQFVAAATADNNGTLTITPFPPPPNNLPYLSATVTDVMGTTFEFYDVGICPPVIMIYLPFVAK